MQSQDIEFWPAHLPRTLTVPQTSLYSNLLNSAERYPDKAALICDDLILSYADLLTRVDLLAGFMRTQCGIVRGERVVIYMQNSVDFVTAYYAILRIGGICVMINPMNRAAELAHFLDDVEANLVVCDSDIFINVAAADQTNRLKNVIVTGLEPESNSPFSIYTLKHAIAAGIKDAVDWRTDFTPHQPAIILYSSGTTGLPKGCVHSHFSLMASTVTVVNWMWVHSEAVVMLSLPLFHITAMQNQLNAPIFSGATIVMLNRWNRERAAALIANHKVTHLTAMPTMITDLLSSPELAAMDLSSISRIGGGGAQMSTGLWARIKDTWGVDFLEGYGLSETGHVTGNSLGHPRRQCLGVPLFNVDLRIVDVETFEDLPSQEVGEIVVNAPQVFQGYWRNPIATEESFFERDGKRYFRTGDLGYHDADGFFYLKDRLKRMVNASGYKVWPAEVEGMLSEHPAIHEACVIAAADAYRGETVKAVIVLREEWRGKATDKDVIEWARERMAAYKYPRIVEFVDALPRASTGKVDWRSLQEKESGFNGNPVVAKPVSETE
jgi:fatty-acyl-CoA synthase